MCDTLGVIKDACAYFGKNSDRSPNEAQVVELYPARANREKTLKATYIEVEQQKETHAVLLSRPVWMWGAEMGLNDCGVAIGNEAVFTKGGYGKAGLTGMDLLRLALERSDSARQALETVLSLLERYGQGGNCGYDHKFYYDNSFLIMDKKELFVLETKDRKWAYRQKERDCISNRLCIREDGTAYSGDSCDFAKTHSDPLFTFFSGSKNRRGLVEERMRADLSFLEIARILRTHSDGVLPLREGSVKSPCMHAGKPIGDHTTQSMIIDFCGEVPLVWTTGCSTPCISLYKPYLFGNEPTEPVFKAGDPKAEAYWRNRERFHRSVLGLDLPKEFYAERDALELGWMNAVRGIRNDPRAMRELGERAAAEEEAFFAAWEKKLPNEQGGSAGFRAYWKKKNSALTM